MRTVLVPAGAGGEGEQLGGGVLLRGVNMECIGAFLEAWHGVQLEHFDLEALKAAPAVACSPGAPMHVGMLCALQQRCCAAGGWVQLVAMRAGAAGGRAGLRRTPGRGMPSTPYIIHTSTHPHHASLPVPRPTEAH